MNIILFPFHEWKKSLREGFRTRDGHWMQVFGQHPLVEKLLIVNRPVSLAEMLVTRRSWYLRGDKILKSTSNFCLSQVAEKTYILDTLVVEIFQPVIKRRAWTPYIMGKKWMADQIRFALKLLQFEEQWVLFSSSPLIRPLLQNLHPHLFALDAQDNLLKNSFFRSIPHLAEYYEYCQENADVLLANSPETTKWFQEKRPDAFLVANGVDPKFFDPNLSYECPKDLHSIPKPIVGYAGKLQEQFDVSLMKYLATSLPNVNFVFIGQNLKPDWGKEIWSYRNVYHLGDKHYHQLPSYLAHFDICFIPYNGSRLHGGDPIKFYEYLAMKKPVVSIEIGDIGKFQDYPQVCIAKSHDEFLSGINKFLQMIQKKKEIPIRELPQECFWEYKAELVLTKMKQTSGSA